VFGRQASQHSVWLFPLNSGSCNGCEQELQALHAARYALEAGGIAFAESPRHADILLLTGILTPRSRDAAQRVWEQLAEPRALIAIGDCPINGSVFRGQANFTPAGEILPVDVELPGCPPSPTLILEAIEAAIKLLDGEAAGDMEEEQEQEEMSSPAENEADEQLGDEDKGAQTNLEKQDAP
jgi:membrane-bound hydrogenase subunit mbhJ